MTGWRHVDLDAVLELLGGWAEHRVLLSVDPASGAPGLARLSGVLRPARSDGDAVTLELAGSGAWLRLPGFRGASYDREAEVLVLEFSGADPSAAVLVDIQLLEPAPEAPSPWALAMPPV